MTGKKIISQFWPETHWSVIGTDHFKWRLADAIDAALFAAREMADALIRPAIGGFSCTVCDRWGEQAKAIAHKDDCLIAKFRALEEGRG